MQMMQIEMDLHKVDGPHDTSKCQQFPFGHAQTSFATFKFSLAKKATALHSVVLESGISTYTDRIKYNELRLDLANIKREGMEDKTMDGKDAFILLKHLSSIFYLNAALQSVLMLVFVVENRFWHRETRILCKFLKMRVKCGTIKLKLGLMRLCNIL